MYVGYDIHWDTGFTLTPVLVLKLTEKFMINKEQHVFSYNLGLIAIKP